MLAFSASTPLLPKSLRHSQTVSSRTPNASAIRGLVQPASVRSTARARSASPRSRKSRQGNPLVVARRNRRLSTQVAPNRISGNRESQNQSVGQPTGFCLGAAFPVFGVNIEETALIAIERAARQRALLVVSDGVGGLLLTKGKGGATPRPGAA